MVAVLKSAFPVILMWEVPKLSVADPAMDEKVWVSAFAPRLKLPEVRLRFPAFKTTAPTVVPPVPFWVMAGKVAPALGVKV